MVLRLTNNLILKMIKASFKVIFADLILIFFFFGQLASKISYLIVNKCEKYQLIKTQLFL
jgi:hypothetical protein